MNKKIFCLFYIAFLSIFVVFAQNLKAKDVALEASKKSNIEESLSYLLETIPKITDLTEKRAIYIFTASLQEQMALYDDAQKSYAQAAAISAKNAEGMSKKSNEQLVLDAVRCALSAGDYATANNYLNSAVRNSKSETIQSHIKLYTQWSDLCKAETKDDLQEPILMLQTYLKLDSMKSVKSSILLTLWYITGEKTYSNQINQEFTNSVEAAIVKGDVQLLPTPFWFFVPKTGDAEVGVGTFAKETTTPTESQSQEKSEKSENKITKLQLGLFRTENNANLLKEELIKKGFVAYITTEKRASGTTYYIVLVNENSQNTVANQLRSAGYECYVLD